MWPLDRREELIMLRLLLNDVLSLDAGNNVIARMTRMIEVAERLTKGDLREPRRSFMDFLHAEATRDDES